MKQLFWGAIRVECFDAFEFVQLTHLQIHSKQIFDKVKAFNLWKNVSSLIVQWMYNTQIWARKQLYVI